MQQFVVLSMLVVMSAGLPQYGYGGVYPPNVQYQGYGGPIGWMPGFYGRSGYHGIPYPSNMANVHNGDGGGIVVVTKTSPLNNGAVNSSGVSSSWSSFPNVMGQSNAVPTDLKTETNINKNESPSVNSELITATQQQETLPNNSKSGQSPPAPTKLSANEIEAAKESMLAYRENAALLLRQADEIEQILQQQK